MLAFLYANSGAPLDAWPQELQNLRVLERLRTRNLIRKKDYPVRYFLTRQGFSLATSIQSLREQRTAKTACA